MSKFEFYAVLFLGKATGAGLSVQVTTMIPYSSHNVEKVQNAFLRIHGIDFRAAGYLNPGYFNVEEV
ncbi:DUF6140 family protein [Formosa sp. 4Alg 33]|uniref:DUF6140 family protein n=1 Tax=Formosa sp. 4Alg 33 TaxID=3382189 RepID=UPI003D9C659B